MVPMKVTEPDSAVYRPTRARKRFLWTNLESHTLAINGAAPGA